MSKRVWESICLQDELHWTCEKCGRNTTKVDYRKQSSKTSEGVKADRRSITPRDLTPFEETVIGIIGDTQIDRIPDGLDLGRNHDNFLVFTCFVSAFWSNAALFLQFYTIYIFNQFRWCVWRKSSEDSAKITWHWEWKTTSSERVVWKIESGTCDKAAEASSESQKYGGHIYQSGINYHD